MIRHARVDGDQEIRARSRLLQALCRVAQELGGNIWMICPRCCSAKLRKMPDGSLLCWQCELRRRPEDRVLVRPATRHWILKRNLQRVPPGSEVEIYTCNVGLSGTYGRFKGETVDLALRSKTGFIIATSTDIEDLAILVVENEWYAQGPEPLLAAMDLLNEV